VRWKTKIFCSQDDTPLTESFHGAASVRCSRLDLPLDMDSQFDAPPGDDLTRPPVAGLGLHLFETGTQYRLEVASEDPDNPSPEEGALQTSFRVTHVSEHALPLCSVENLHFLAGF